MSQTMRKKLAFFVTNDLVYDQRMQRICSALEERGFDVTLIGRQRAHASSTSHLPFSTKRFTCFFNKGFSFYAEINWRICMHILFSRYDVVCAIDLDTIAGVHYGARLKKIPFVFDAHEWFTEVPELIHRPKVRSIWKKIEYAFVPKSTARYTVNQSLAEIFEANHKLNFDVIRNVPMKQSFTPVAKNSRKTIIYQGALNVGRGLEVAIEAMSQLPEMELWLVGEGDLSQQLREQASTSVAADRIKFLGYKTPKELKAITPQAHIGLNLLEGDSQNYYYSLANKFFDFMQAGIPSINMEFPEYENILKEHTCGTMISACVPDVLAREIVSILSDEMRYEKMMKACETAREHFIWEKEKEKLVSIYERIIDE